MKPQDFVSKFRDIDNILEDEWKAYLVNLSLLNIQDKFSEKVMKVFERLSSGETPKDIAEDMDMPYNKRVIAKLREEIKRLEHELC